MFHLLELLEGESDGCGSIPSTADAAASMYHLRKLGERFAYAPSNSAIAEAMAHKHDASVDDQRIEAV